MTLVELQIPQEAQVTKEQSPGDNGEEFPSDSENRTKKNESKEGKHNGQIMTIMHELMTQYVLIYGAKYKLCLGNVLKILLAASSI